MRQAPLSPAPSLNAGVAIACGAFTLSLIAAVLACCLVWNNYYHAQQVQFVRHVAHTTADIQNKLASFEQVLHDTRSGKHVRLSRDEKETSQKNLLLRLPAQVDNNTSSTADRSQKSGAYLQTRLDVSDFMEAAHIPSSSPIRLRVFDGPEINSESLLYDSRIHHAVLHGEPFDEESALTETTHITADGRTLTLRFDADQAFTNQWTVFKTETLMAAAGMLLGLSLYGLAQAIVRSQQPPKAVAGKDPPVYQVNTAWYDRVQSIAQFGTYEIRMDHVARQEINEWSNEIYRILGRNPEEGPLPKDAYIDQYVHPEDCENTRLTIRNALTRGESTVSEYRIRCADGTVKHVYDYLEFVRADNGQWTFAGQLFDMTERKQIENERLESAAIYQTFIEQLGGIPYIASLDAHCSNIHVSDRIERQLGFTPEQWCGDPELRLRQLHDDDRAAFLNAIGAHISNQAPLSIDYRIYGQDGSLHWFHDEARIMTAPNGKPMFLQGVMFDITERKQAQQELERSHSELKKLITALDDLREEEQRRLAREMHDDLGQLLAAMKMDLSDLQQYLPQNNVKVLQRLDGIHDLVNAMVTSVRRIIADLPPKVLEDLGLFNAIEFMTSNFQKRYSIHCDLSLPNQEIVFEQRAATAIYRMIQEVLNNVARHACATRVSLVIEALDDRIVLCVTDNGKGMAKSPPCKAGSFGLIGIRERAASLKGAVNIESAPKNGTTIRIMIPRDARIVAEQAQ